MGEESGVKRKDEEGHPQKSRVQTEVEAKDWNEKRLRGVVE